MNQQLWRCERCGIEHSCRAAIEVHCPKNHPMKLIEGKPIPPKTTTKGRT